MATRSIRAEAFRQLRTNLQFIDAARPVGVLVVTSSIADEGKSTTATNLALSFAEYGKRVLLIEADLRRPRVAEYLGIEGAVGLTNVLAGQVALDDVLQPWGKRADRSAQRHHSAQPVRAARWGTMEELLVVLRRHFDMIVIDTPPLLPVTDAAVASRLADGAVVIVRYGKTTRNQLATALRSLAAVDARLLGTVLTMAPTKGAEAYSAYGYQATAKKRRSKIIPPTPPTAPSSKVALEQPHERPRYPAARRRRPRRRSRIPSTPPIEPSDGQPSDTEASATDASVTDTADTANTADTRTHQDERQAHVLMTAWMPAPAAACRAEGSR